MAVTNLIDRSILIPALRTFKTKLLEVITGESVPVSSSDSTTIQTALNAKLNKNNAKLTTSGLFYTGTLSGSWAVGVCCQGQGFAVPITCGGTITSISGNALVGGSWVTLANGRVSGNAIQRYLLFDQHSGMSAGDSYLCSISCTVA